MSVLESLLTTGRIVDLMAAFLVVEVIIVTLLRKTRGSGIALLPLLVNIGAGGSLMLALRTALTGTEWKWTALCLMSALVFHLSDLFVRWQPAPAD